MEFDHQIVKANDIRGRYPDAIDENFAFMLGRGLVTALQAQNVLLGRDCRLSSPALSAAVSAGVGSRGGTVDFAGLCPSELLYYLMGTREAYDLAVMVTASHNPGEYNGFKLIGPGGKPLTSADALSELQTWLEGAKPAGCPNVDEPEPGIDPKEEYIHYVLQDFDETADISDLKVVVDPGNGTGGILWEELSEAIGLDPVKMNFIPDGQFPAHMPNPARLCNIEPLKSRVQEENADVGFAYDGDADRTVAVLPNGHVVDGSEMIVTLFSDLTEETEAPRPAVSMTTSRKVLDFLHDRGIEPLMVPVGHAKIKRIMRDRSDIDFGGEESGHYFYRRFFCCESSMITTLHLLHQVAEGRLAGLLDKLPGPWERPDPEPDFPFSDTSTALEACRRAARQTLKTYPDPQEIMCEDEWTIMRNCTAEDIDCASGVRLDYGNWWVALRPSGTEPLARLAGEGRNRRDIEQKCETISTFFPSAG